MHDPEEFFTWSREKQWEFMENSHIGTVFANWLQAEFHCLIARTLFAPVAYVGVSEGHSFCGYDYNDSPFCDVSVHGGLTYAGWGGELALVSRISMKERWYFGWDYAHGGDQMFKVHGIPDGPKIPGCKMWVISDIYPQVLSVVEQFMGFLEFERMFQFEIKGRKQ